jgi:hypothetical protein
MLKEGVEEDEKEVKVEEEYYDDFDEKEFLKNAN